MAHIVFIEKIPREGPCGDRDRERHLYFDYRVHVLNELSDVPTEESAVHSISGFENWNYTIRPEADVIADVTAFAEKLASRLGAGIIWGGEGLSVFKIVCEALILATDQQHAAALFKARYEAGEINFRIIDQSKGRR